MNISSDILDWCFQQQQQKELQKRNNIAKLTLNPCFTVGIQQIRNTNANARSSSSRRRSCSCRSVLVVVVVVVVVSGYVSEE